MTQFNEATTRKVADLARLELSDAEVTAFTNQIGSILKYVDKLSELNTENVEPMTNSLEQEIPMSDDVLTPGPGTEKMLAPAPEAIYENYKVPQVIGGSQ